MKPDLAVEIVDAISAAMKQAERGGKKLMRADAINLVREKLKKPPKAKGTRPGNISDELWLVTLEAEPALEGVDIRKALAAAQFWCKNHSKICTRRFFTDTWLPRADRTITHPGGKTSTLKMDADAEPDNWRTEATRLKLNARAKYTAWSKDSFELLCAKTWKELSVDLKADILKAL